MRRGATDPLDDAAALATPGDWLRAAERGYARAGVALGQVSDNAHDEALYLILHALGLPLESGPEVLARRLTPGQRETLRVIFHRRLRERVPAAYLTGEAWLAGFRFQVDQRVIIPRSYFLELIPEELSRRLPSGRKVRRVIDVCTGSGCLAILLAKRFPSAEVDACDLSEDALEVARINRRLHRLERRLHLHRSDVLAGVPPARYDFILSNPPYEPSRLVDGQAPEFAAEPRMAHDGGADGMAIVRRLVAEAPGRLEPHGFLVIEVGGLRARVDREFSHLGPEWLPTADGTDCVVLFPAARLATAGAPLGKGS